MPQATAEDLAVIEAVIDGPVSDYMRRPGGPLFSVVLVDHTVHVCDEPIGPERLDCLPARQAFQGLASDALFQRNVVSVPIEQIQRDWVRPAPVAKMLEMFRGGSSEWSEFYRVYPKAVGFVRASLPAYSAGGMAEVYAELDCRRPFFCALAWIATVDRKTRAVKTRPAPSWVYIPPNA